MVYCDYSFIFTASWPYFYSFFFSCVPLGVFLLERLRVIMENSADSSSKGFFFGAIQKISSPSSSLTGTPYGELPGALSKKESSPTTSPVSSLPLNWAVSPDSASDSMGRSGTGASKVVGGGDSCYAQKVGYRQCLELNPDDKANCTWALDNYLKCKER